MRPPGDRPYSSDRGRREVASRPAISMRVTGDKLLAQVLANALSSTGRSERFTHGFHTYPAGLHPDAAREVIRALGQRRVFDPFCGGGTILVEAAALGLEAVGCDISPIAQLVAKARTAQTDDDSRTQFRAAARALASEAQDDDRLPPDYVMDTVHTWYQPHVACELASLRRGIARYDGLTAMLLTSVFSSILIKASLRRSDTSPARVEIHRPPGTTAILFHKKARELARGLADLAAAVPPDTRWPTVRAVDARSVRDKTTFDLILTSPPYPATYDYLPMQTLRAAWLDLDLPVEREIGARRDWRRGAKGALGRWREATSLWMSRAAASLDPGGYLVIIIGDGLAPTGGIDALEPTRAAAHHAGLHEIATAHAVREDSGRQRPIIEHALVFQRGSGKSA